MDVKRLGIGIVAGTVALYILGYIIWGLLGVDDVYNNWAGGAINVNRPDSLLWSEIVGLVAYAALLVIVIDKGASVADAAKRGALVAFLAWAMAHFILFSFQDIWTMPGPIVDAVLEGVRGGIVGAVLATVFAKTGT